MPRPRLVPGASLLVVAAAAAACARGGGEPEYDFDGDGLRDEEDCAPADPAIHPGAADPFGDGIDQDCDGGDGADGDGDGWPAPGEGVSEGEGDCDDGDPEVHPGAAETSEDGVDQDCDGLDDADEDGDGTPDEQDCAPTDPAVHDEDRDGDGVSPCDGDCDDGDPAIHDLDLDGDGVSTCDGDCDDGDPARAPGAYEACDFVDNDCDGAWEHVSPYEVADVRCAHAIFFGTEPIGWAGNEVAVAGDIDGDGAPDLLVGVFLDDTGGEDAGAAYLVPGPPLGALGPEDASAFLVGEAPGDRAGAAVSAAGDVDGDGLGDLLVGAYESQVAGIHSGSAYLLYGPVEGTIPLAEADVRIRPSDEWQYVGNDFAALGDLDGDGYGDFAVAAPGASLPETSAGAVYIFRGPLAGPEIDVSQADATLRGFEAWALAGSSVSAVGDVDGDGEGDLLVGALWSGAGGTESGAAYLVRGPFSGSRSLANATAVFVGEEPGDEAGHHVAPGGDVDADGHLDLLIAAEENAAVAPDAGAVYLVRGPVSGTVDLGAAPVRLTGEDEGDRLGYSVAGGFDFDGDGFDDFIAGAPNNSAGGSGGGVAYLVLGPVSGTLPALDVSVLLRGYDAGGGVGVSLAAGDLDGDGFDDLILGAPAVDTAIEQVGAAYVLYGEAR